MFPINGLLRQNGEDFAIIPRIEKDAQRAKLPHGRHLEIASKSNSVSYLLVTETRFILEEKVVVLAEMAPFGRAALTFASPKGPFVNDLAAKLW